MHDPVIYIVDDDPSVMDGLRALLLNGRWRVECHASGRDFLGKLDPEQAGCLLLDLRMSDMRGVEVLAALKERSIELPTIVITGYADVPTAVTVMQGGVLDLLEKPVDQRELVQRIEQALERDRSRREALTNRADLEARWSRLTVGERTVARMLCDGKSSRDIGLELKVGRRTIENRRANIMLKLGATSLAHLVRIICGAGPDFPPPEPSADC